MEKIGKYSIGLEINGEAANALPSNISFVLGDSIHSLYSRATLTINDLDGYGLESRVFTSGSKITLIFGYGEDIIKAKFIVDYMEVPKTIKSGQLSGTITVYLIHESFAKSQTKTQSLESRPSFAINDLFEYSFEEMEVEETKELKLDHLYRPRMNEKDTIEKILLPNSVSSNLSPSPYFCFIDIKGKLTYKSFLGMINSDSSYSLFQTLTDDLEYYYSKIFEILPFTEKLESARDHIVYELSYFDNENLEYASEDIEIANMKLGGYPIFNTTVSKKPYFLNITGSESLDRYRAHAYNLQRNFLLPDKLILSMPLFLGFTSGKMITVTARYGGELSASYSYSKKYLIERANQVWNGNTNSGLSQLVVSKAYPEFPVGSTIEKGVYSND